MICSFNQAKALAEKTVADIGAAAGDEFAITGYETIEAKGWMFFYNSKEFIETGSFSSALAGNGPIFVGRDGVLRTVPTFTRWEDAIKSL